MTLQLNFKAEIYGDSQERGHLQQLIDQHQLNDNYYHPATQQLNTKLSNSKITVYRREMKVLVWFY